MHACTFIVQEEAYIANNIGGGTTGAQGARAPLKLSASGASGVVRRANAHTYVNIFHSFTYVLSLRSAHSYI